MVRQQVAQAAADNADVVVLPEIWTTGAFDIELGVRQAEALAGPTTAALSALAAEQGIWLHGGSFLELEGGHVYNTSTLFDQQGELVARYRKVHLFGFDTGEAALLSAGSELVIMPTPLGATALATCYDLRFPELFRAFTAAGAEAVLLSSSWPLARIAHWRTLIAARAIENQLPVIACNATGSHAGVVLGGESMIVDATGLLLAKADHEPTSVSATIDPAVTARTRLDFPVLRDRRL
jgi:predicted amidohydrolase